MNWLRFYCDSLENEKVQQLAPELYKAWVNLLCIARRFDGGLPSLSKIAFQLHVEPETAGAWVTALIDRRLFDQTATGVRPHDWFEYQYDSDDGAARIRKWRAKKKKKEVETLHVTPMLRTRAEQNRKEVLPSGNTEKPAAEKLSMIEAARLLIADYPDTRSLTGEPDSVLAAHCLELAGGSIEELGRGLRALMLTGKKPGISWAWFRTVLPTYLRRRA